MDEYITFYTIFSRIDSGDSNSVIRHFGYCLGFKNHYFPEYEITFNSLVRFVGELIFAGFLEILPGILNSKYGKRIAGEFDVRHMVAMVKCVNTDLAKSILTHRTMRSLSFSAKFLHTLIESAVFANVQYIPKFCDIHEFEELLERIELNIPMSQDSYMSRNFEYPNTEISQNMREFITHKKFKVFFNDGFTRIMVNSGRYPKVAKIISAIVE